MHRSSQHTVIGYLSRFAWAAQAGTALALLLIAYVAGSYVWNIGHGEFFAWDEALYAWRAKVALVEGQWLDQVEWSDSGFYSAAFPPLLIWQMAAMFKVFGFEEWAARLPVALQGILCVGSLAWMAWRTGGAWAGVLTVAMIGSISYFTRFANMTQFDVPCVAWPAFALALYVQSLRQPERRRTYVYLAGVAIGLGLMSKIAISGFIYFVIWGLQAGAALLGRGQRVAETDTLEIDGPTFLFRAGEWRRALVDNLVLAGAAALVWLPWHIYMTWKHGQTFWDWYIGFHLLERTRDAIAGEDYAWWINLRGIWTYVPNVLKGLMVLGIPLALAWALLPLVRPRQEGTRRLAAMGLALVPPLVWTLLLFALFQATTTKREEYMVLVYPGLACLMGMVIGRLLTQPSSPAVHAAAVLAAIAGMLLQTFRESFDAIWFLLMDKGMTFGQAAFWHEGLPFLRGYAIAAIAASASLIALVEMSCRLIRRGVLLPWRRAIYQAVLLALLAVGLASGGLRAAYKPTSALRKVIFGPILPWLKNEAKYPHVLFIGGFWDAYGSAETYYLNGNTPRSKPIAYRPIERVPDHTSDRIAAYRKPGGVLIVNDWQYHEAGETTLAKSFEGFREVRRYRHYAIWEWQGTLLEASEGDD